MRTVSATQKTHICISTDTIVDVTYPRGTVENSGVADGAELDPCSPEFPNWHR